MTNETDELAQLRTLRDQHARGWLSEAEYWAAYRALNTDVDRAAHPYACEFAGGCPNQGLAWHEGHIYCAAHFPQARSFICPTTGLPYIPTRALHERIDGTVYIQAHCPCCDAKGRTRMDSDFNPSLPQVHTHILEAQ